MSHDDFKLDTTFTDAPKKWVKPAAIIAAVVLVAVIVLTATTNLASRVLPMDESYVSALIPQAPDGQEPLSLKTLEQDITETVLTVNGSVENRTGYSIAGISAVIQPIDVYGLTLMPVEASIDPAELPAHGMGEFHSTVTLKDRPSGYSIKFRLVDGPFIPHKDDRAPAPSTP